MNTETLPDDGPIGLSVVVPCYNEQDSIDELVRRVSLVCYATHGDDYEIILVNDGSRDDSWAAIMRNVEQSTHLIGIDLARNHGHQLALSAGMRYCRGDLILILDADLQDPPELLPEMLDLMRQGHDVVYGQRAVRRGESLFKRSSASLFYRIMTRLMDSPLPRDTGDFRLMTRRVLRQLNAMPERYRFIRGMVSWIGFSQTPLYYERAPRFAGSTHYPLRKMISFALDAVTSFSVVPLRFASHLGMIFGLAGMVALGWIVYAYLTEGTVVGWTSLAALILILGSVQLLMLGVFGEYLGRMYIESKHRPLFVVREIAANRTMDAANPVHRMNDRIWREVNGRS
jgi:polyisoprenyl-phosphate glycosyltransferase